MGRNRHQMMWSVLLPFAVGLLLSGAAAFAQTGKISGKIVDNQSRQALPGVNVVLEGTTLGAATDEDGDYFIINVPPGVYTLQTSMIGYAQQSKTDVRVQVDRTVVVDFEMGAQAVQGEEVTISAEKEIIQMDISGSTTYMAAEEFTTAPVTTVADYLLIQEGIEYESTGQGKWLSVRGGGMDETDMMVDGVSTMNAMSTTAYMGISRTAIKEVSVQTGGFNAEYGRARSGIVNVVTRDGSRQEYSLAMDSKYSFPHLKHFGRNLFDRQSPLFVTLFGQDNFTPGEFNGTSFTPTGDATYGGVRGEVSISDYNSPQYRGWTNVQSTNDYTYLNAGGTATPFTEAEKAQYGMESIYAYPFALNFQGWSGLSASTQKNTILSDNMYPADVMALDMMQLQGWRYGQDPDYDMDVTISGPLPGEGMNNRLGAALAKSTFMLSYRTQTSRMVFPGAQNTYRDRNLQAKITTTLTPQTKLRFSALYGESFSAARSGGNLVTWKPDLESGDFYENDASATTVETISGVDGGSRLGTGIGRSTQYLFDEGRMLKANTYFFQTGAKLTHTVNPSTYFELEYGFNQTNNDLLPTWGRDINTEQYWVFNIDGLTTTAADGSVIPRTFVTNDPDDIFADGVAQMFDPVLKSLWDSDNVGLSHVPAGNRNARNRIFSTGGAGTWVYSPDLVSSWFDEMASGNIGGESRGTSNYTTLKGPSRLDMARALQGVPGYEAIDVTDPALLPGSWDLPNIMNRGRLPALTSPAYGGLVNNHTLPGVQLVSGWYDSNHGESNSSRGDETGKYLFGDANQSMGLSFSQAHTGRMTLVSQVSKYHQFKAGADFTFWRVESEVIRTQGDFRQWDLADRSLGHNRWQVRGNWVTQGYTPYAWSGNTCWDQFYDNPFEMSAYIQDKIEVQGLIANLGMRMDMFDPTSTTIDFNDPWNYAAWNLQPVPGAPIKSRPAIKWSPRLGLSFPVTETSKVYFNYGWFYQRPAMSNYFQNTRHAGGEPVYYVANGNMEWPRTVQAEMGYEQNVRGWFLLHAAGYVKDGSNLVSQFEWKTLTQVQNRTLMNNNYNDIRGFEVRMDKNYGLLRTRLNYNFMLRTRGLINGTQADENLLAQIAIDQENERGQRAIQPQAMPTFRGTIGFFTPRNWGPQVGEKIHPFDNLIINAIYRWQDAGQHLLIEEVTGRRPDLNIWVDQYNQTRTDLRAEKRVGIGRSMNVGLFVQVTNLFDQKYLQAGMDQYYEATFKTLYEGGEKDLKWGNYKKRELLDELGGYWLEGTLFNDKRDVFYGMSFTYN